MGVPRVKEYKLEKKKIGRLAKAISIFKNHATQLFFSIFSKARIPDS